MHIARTLAELATARRALDLPPDGLGLAPTMGALHEGHLALIRAGQRDGLAMAASIFVNPLQFAATEDLSRYPRDEAADLAKLEAAGCVLAWLPGVEEMYPAGHATAITVGGPSELWEGAARPGHFSGVATVVAILFGQVRPHAAYFGEKDWQQVQVVRRLVRDLALGVDIRPVPTVRESDGLAMSSRNRFLTAEERARAPALYRALQAMAAGEEVRAGLEAEGFAVDYLVRVDAETLQPGPGARILAAARLGSVRLLDNIAVASSGV